jgi:hypothetical protein
MFRAMAQQLHAAKAAGKPGGVGTDSCVAHAAGKPISGSPFMCHVSAGEVDAGNSRLFGPGLQAVQLGRESQLFCELADAFGNKVESAAANGADLKVLQCADKHKSWWR